MKFTMHMPIGEIAPGEFQTQAAIGEMAAALEAAGVDAGYVTDHPAPDAAWLHANGHDALDPFTAFAFVAAASTKLRLHTNIVVLPYRNPFITAKAAASLHVLSGGRLILGVGAGYQQSEFEALGVDFRRRGKLMDEALEVIRLAWAGGPVVKQGMTFNAAGNEPRPALPSPPPVWIGGGSDKAIERAARWGDGWSPYFSAPTYTAANQRSAIQTVDHLRERIAEVQEIRAKLGRSGPYDIVIGPMVRLGYCKPDGADAFINAIHELAESGVTWATVEPPHRSRQHYLECVAWFGEEVVAKLR